MARSASSRPGRTLAALVGIIAVIFGVIGAGVMWSSAQWTPKLALDLEGGTEIVLTAVPQPGTSGAITQETLDEAVRIIRQRINGSGVSEAEITTQGERNIIVSLPGTVDEATREAVSRAAALEFRPVLYEQGTQPTEPTTEASPTGDPSATPSASSTGTASPKASASATVKASPSASASANPMGLPGALLAATPTPSPTGAASGSASASEKAPLSVKPTDASDMNWITDPVAEDFGALDCTDQNNLKGRGATDQTKALVTCDTEGSMAFILGPTELTGRDIKSASASLETSSQGVTGTAWQVNMEFTGEGATKFAAVTQRLFSLEEPRNQFAIVLDGLVVSYPQTNDVINTGNAQITGNFTQEEAQGLANQLKFGALPISFQKQTEANISATLGGEQLQRGLLAGLIGLILVVIYSLLQYRALGLVTVSSLIIAAVITYGLVVLLGWRQGYRLSLPGVTGLIVAIGITADSFIVYFERIRDEVRDGRSLAAAVEAAWARARRTILISDAVSLLAAVVLYALAVGGVRGFAFTLGLTTVIDVLVVFLFTHPMVVMLSRRKFFASGHRLSGFDAVHLGRSIVYTGRAQTRNKTPKAAVSMRKEPDEDEAGLGESGGLVRTGTTIAERRAAAEKAKAATALGGSESDGAEDSLSLVDADVASSRKDA